MISKIRGSAPGKVLWLGGYSVLERPNIGFVTTVNSRVYVEATRNASRRIEIDAPQFGSRIEGVVETNGRIMADVDDKLKLIFTCVEVTLRYVIATGRELGGVSITTKSDPEILYKNVGDKIVKSGLGSSAAVSVAAVGTLLRLFEIDDPDNQKTHKLAQLAHSLATGKVGSGFDVASATFGSIIYVRYSPSLITALPKEFSNEELLSLINSEWDYSIEKMTLPNSLIPVMANFSGEGTSTHVSVSKVFEFKKESMEEYRSIISAINSANLDALKALKRLSETPPEDVVEEFVHAFDVGRAATKELGKKSGVNIEDDYATDLIEESKKNGALVAKLPGSGGRDAIVALTKDTIQERRLRGFWGSRKDLEVMDISFSNRGFEYNIL